MFESFAFPAHRLGLAAVLALTALGLVACKHRPPQGGFANEMEAGIPRIALHATGEFFTGQLVVNATVSRGMRPGARNDKERRSIKKDSGGMSGGFGHGGGMGGGPGGGMEGMGGAPGGGGSGRPGMGQLGSSAPPVLLRVELVNHGETDLQVTIRDVNSDLGNFVPRPEKVLLAPGQSTQLEPMISRLGVVAAEIPLQLSFRVGDKIEDQTLMLRTASETPTGASP